MRRRKEPFLPDEMDMLADDIAVLRSIGRDLAAAVRGVIADHREAKATNESETEESCS